MDKRLCHLALALFLGAHLAARADEDCDKNHYILSDPHCPAPAAVDTAIGSPGSVAVDSAGNVYFSSPHVIFRLAPDGALARIAGAAQAGYRGDGGPAVDALLNFPREYPELIADPFDFMPLLGPLAVDRDGNLYIGDAYNNRVRRIGTDGTIDTVARTDWPQGVAVSPAGKLYVVGAYGDVVRYSALYEMEDMIAGSNCGPGFWGPGICAPEGAAVDASERLYVSDIYARVRRILPDGKTATIAGNTAYSNGCAWTSGYNGDGRPALGASLSYPQATALDDQGNLFIADTYNDCIRRVDLGGTITTVAGICDAAWNSPRRFAGDGGPATEARLNRPHGVAVDASGNVFIADTFNNRLRKVDPDGIITTVAGNGEALGN